MKTPHTCHARRCKVEVPRKMLMCGRHWYMVSPKLRSAVWLHYQVGQESGRATPSPEWHEAADAAIEAVAEREARA